MPNVLPAYFSNDDFLPAQEALDSYKEKIEKDLDVYRLWDHDSFKDFERRKGEVTHVSRFLYRLLRLYPRLIIQRQINFPDDWGLYVQRGKQLVFLTGISKGWLTEFSYTTVDAHNLPSDPVWGWRHVLVRLMSKGILTWEEVIKEFGNCKNANSTRWDMYTEAFRTHQSSGMIHTNLKSHFE